jgi:hypothetical protein
MWKRKKRKKEWLPWYRARNYKGDLTEAEKRQLDAFRTQSEHPAACLEQLPQEVGDYISRMELELYERKEQELGLMYFFVFVGFALPVLNYFDYVDSKWSYVGVALALIGLWHISRYKRKNPDVADFFNPDAPGTDEEFRKEWEWRYIHAARRQEHEEED